MMIDVMDFAFNLQCVCTHPGRPGSKADAHAGAEGAPMRSARRRARPDKFDHFFFAKHG